LCTITRATAPAAASGPSVDSDTTNGVLGGHHLGARRAGQRRPAEARLQIRHRPDPNSASPPSR
jgi:hypothetical protein